MGFYTTNMVKYRSFVGKDSFKTTGKYVMPTPASTTALHPFVVPTDTGIFVDLLVRAPPKQNLLAVSETECYETFMKILTEVTGVPSEAKEITVTDADKAAPGGFDREAAESTATSAEFGWGDHLVLPKDLDPDVKTTSLRGYIEGEDWKTFFGN